MSRTVIDLQTLFARRALNQRCARCGLVEAAGSYCTRCLSRTSLVDYRAARRLRLGRLQLPTGAPIAA